MRLASFTAGGGATFGVVVQGGVVDARRWLGGRFEFPDHVEQVLTHKRLARDGLDVGVRLLGPVTS